MNKKEDFYDGGRMLSYGKHWNIIMGHRSTGKTFYFKKRAIMKFINQGKGTVWMRRYKSELKPHNLKKFFIDVEMVNRDRFDKGLKLWFPLESKFEVKGSVGYMDGKAFIQFIPLSIAMTVKSVPFDDCDDIIFDEFIIDKQYIRYLTNEVETFNEFLITFMRQRFDEVFVYMLANAISQVNPYFLYYNIKMTRKEFTFDRTGELLIQNFKIQSIIDSYSDSWFGRLMQGTEYFAYAVENEFLRDNDKFLEKRTPNSTFRFAIYYKKQFYGFWVDFKSGLMYASEKYDPSSFNIYTLTREDHSINMLLIKNRSNTYISEMIFQFKVGALRFENMKVKSYVLEILSFFIR